MRLEAVPAPHAIIGIGNSMRGDDGIGEAVIHQLGHSELALHVRHDIDLLLLDGEGTRLLAAWKGRELVVVVDAVRAGDVPGTIHRLDVGIDPLPAWTRTASSHGAGLAAAIDLARNMHALPRELVIFGVEPSDLSMGEGLSPEVAEVLPILVDQILDDVRTRT